MITEILKVIPRLDSAALGKMESTLNKRFTRVAKKFGFGLMNVIKGSGLIGLAVGFIDKLLNPLKETQEAIERMISQGDDIVTNAEQFGTTAGKLFKVMQFAKASGLDNEGLFMLMTKYQTSLAEAKADPSKPTSVRAYANDTDIADSFFQFIQSLKKMDRDQQILVQKEIFGEKQILKMADFLRGDFAKLQGIMKLRGSEAYTGPLEKMGDLKDYSDALAAGREANDVFTKSRLINKGMIQAINNAEKRNLQQENDRIANFQNLKAIADTTQNIMMLVEKLVSVVGALLTPLLPVLTQIVDFLRKMTGSRLMRGWLKYTGQSGE